MLDSYNLLHWIRELCCLTGDAEKVKRLDALVTKMAGFEKYYAVTGQTYSRKVDVECLNALSSLGATIHKVIFNVNSSCSLIKQANILNSN